MSAEDECSGKNILEALPYGAVLLNEQGQVIWLNSVAKNILGFDYIHWPWIEVIGLRFSPQEDDGHEISLVDGRRVQVAVTASDALPGQLVTLVDLTLTRQYEKNRSQEQRLAAIGQMTAQLAHQIRTPLASAVLFMDQLSERLSLQDSVQRYVQRIQECHTSIAQQINDLLLYSRGESLVMENVSSVEWVQQLRQRLTREITGKTIHLSVHSLIKQDQLTINAEALSGAVSNLVHNALQADADNIEVRLEEAECDDWQIVVKDNGSGIEKDVLKTLGTPFVTTRAQGSGLGLAVVMAVCKAHGGEVDITSSPEGGTRVAMRLAREQESCSI